MQHTRFNSILMVVLLALPYAVSRAADWPQYHGPNGDSISTEKVKLPWPAAGPKVVWKIPTLNGFSSFAVAGGQAFTQVNRDIDNVPWEICVALDAATGKEQWFAKTDIGNYEHGGDSGTPGNKGGDGPRSTPAFGDGKVYVLTQNLVLHSLDAQNGKSLWSHDLMKEFSGRNIGWKSAASPMIDGDLVFVGGGGPGQSLLAFNKKTGDVVWKGEDEVITHATPVAATIHGERQVIFFVKKGLVSVS